MFFMGRLVLNMVLGIIYPHAPVPTVKSVASVLHLLVLVTVLCSAEFARKVVL